MFEPRERLNYGDLLKPPKGFLLERAVATSFSLDFDALTASIFALALGQNTDAELIDNPAMCLRSLKTIADKLVLFSEAGQIKKPQKDNPLYALLSQTVSTVAIGEKSKANSYPAFHPKVWIVEYKGIIDKQPAKKYKLLIMSRNLTFDRSYDACVAFDGKVCDDKTKIAKTKPLIDFLEFLKNTIKSDDSHQKKKESILNDLIKSLESVSFCLGENNNLFGDFELLPLGISGAKNMLDTEFADNCFHNLVIMSPFLSNDIIERFSKNNSKIGEERRRRTLITRISEIIKILELDKLDKDCLDKWNIYVMKKDVVYGERRMDDGEELMEQDIHAKIFLRNYHNFATLYMGSANASFSAFNRNVEFMIALHKRNRTKGYMPEQFLNELIGDENARDCLFEKIDISKITINQNAESEEEKRKKELEKIIKTFCRKDIKAEVIKTDDKFSIEIKIDKKDIDDSFDCLTIVPLGEKNPKKIAEKIVFENVNLLHLSEFYTLNAENETLNLTRVIMIPTLNIPFEEVDKNVIKSVIKNTDDFYGYLNAILSDDVLMGYLSRNIDNRVGIGNIAGQQIGTALYEKLLYTSAHFPERFEEITEVEKKLSNDIVIEKFKQTFEKFEKAIENAKKKC